MTVPYTGTAGALAVADYVTGRVQASLSEDVVRVDVRPGIVAWDACDCGQFTLALARMYLSAQFPVEDGAGQILGAGEMFVIDYQAAVMRCFPVINDDGSTPTVEAMRAASQQIADDGSTLIHTVPAALGELEAANMIGQWAIWPCLFPGPFGGCGGAQLNFQVGLVQ